MKLIKGLGLLSFLVAVTSSCFNPPEFPVVPQIEFDKIEFINSPDPSDFDSLNLYIRFKDGDGDLGFTKSAADISAPFQNSFYYQENNGSLKPLSTVSGFVGDVEYDLLEIADPLIGKLVTYGTRKKAGYDFLPQTFGCSSYEYLGGPFNPDKSSDGRRLLIEKADLPALGPQVKLVDSIPTQDPQYYQIRDTLYFTPNPNHYNIKVEFLVKDSGGGFNLFDWQKEFCTTFDGRFPVFSDKQSSIDGTLKYSMTSFGFTSLFSIKTLKLRISIKDRALNQSNVIETPEFTLLP